MNIVEQLNTQVKRHPQAIALIEVKKGVAQTYSFSAIRRASARAANMLYRTGLRRGDPVLVFLPMSFDLYTALLAIFQLQLVAVFIDPSAGIKQIERCCSLYPPKAVIGTPKAHLLRIISPGLKRIPVKFSTKVPLPGAACWHNWRFFSERNADRPCDVTAPALVTFTSGSTGKPKAAVRSHGFLLAQHRALSQTLNFAEGDIVLSTLPIFVLSHLGMGVTSLIPEIDLRHPDAIDPALIVQQIHSNHITCIEASPAFFEPIVKYGTQHHLTLPGLKKIFTGGGPVFPRLINQLQRLAPNAEILAMYGSTEAEPIALISGRCVTTEDIQCMVSGRGLLTGPPVKDIQLRIIPDSWGSAVGPFSESQFKEICLPPDQVGEIVVSGPHVLPGYLGGVDDSETKFEVGKAIWHRTGDAGYLDPGGRLWLLGRCVARMNGNRGELYPFAVECAAYHNHQIRRSACVAHNNRRLLIIEVESNTFPAELSGLKNTLSWASIDEIVVCKKIPVDKRHNSKIDYPALYEMLERSHVI